MQMGQHKAGMHGNVPGGHSLRSELLEGGPYRWNTAPHLPRAPPCAWWALSTGSKAAKCQTGKHCESHRMPITIEGKPTAKCGHQSSKDQLHNQSEHRNLKRNCSMIAGAADILLAHSSSSPQQSIRLCSMCSIAATASIQH